jgi:hypothetical protein
MGKLPLEMKQRICSFLRDSPKLLKPIRLVSKQWASAAEPYLIPRVFLFKHKDSCAEVREIVEHPVFGKHVTTLVVDPRYLRNHRSSFSWDDIPDDYLGRRYSCWWDLKIKEISYIGDGDPLLQTPHAHIQWSSQTLRSQERYWKAQYQIANYQSSDEFCRHFLNTIAHAFRMCPNLVNVVIAPPQPNQDQVISKLFSIFQSIHPQQGAWVDLNSYRPAGFGLAELLSTANQHNVGLNSLTIIDIPFKVADYSEVGDLRAFKSLKHIRIDYNCLGKNPKASFGFNLEEAIHEASSLETLWISMPEWIRDYFDGDMMLQAINSETLRDVLLRKFAVSEDALVSFLLRHSRSLQQLDLCIALTAGTWTSVLRRISCRMTALKGLRFFGIWVIDGSWADFFTYAWCLEARNFVLEGGVLPESYTEHEYEDSNYDDDIDRHNRTYRDLPENGLWSDYDGVVKFN